MVPIILATMPYTGTRFFLKTLKEATGAKPYQLTYRLINKYNGWEQLVWSHLEPPTMQLIHNYIADHDPVIVTTLRSKEAIEGSWKRRMEDKQRVLESYECWDEFISLYDPVIVSVDTKDKDARLAELSEAIGVKLETDWRIVR